ncbi:MAG: hypothetical protein IT373_20485 [Polyangiaceae bacterium]|nr:hypothetical protein [Polyangiaceae bacterium]
MAHSEVEALLAEAEQARREQADPERRLEVLIRLARAAAPRSHGWLYAQRHIAELCAAEDPWRASLLARRVVAVWAHDDGAWAILGLAQSLLGHLRFAVRAYRRALALAPDNPYYAHNLGHLYDVAVGRPELAVPLLERAWRRLPHEPEIVCSLAHALARDGKARRARHLLAPVLRSAPNAERRALGRFVAGLARREGPAAATRTASGGPEEPARRRSRKRRHTRAPSG